MLKANNRVLLRAIILAAFVTTAPSGARANAAEPAKTAPSRLVLPPVGVEKTIVIDRVLRIESDVTVPPEVSLRVERGGRLWIGPKATLTLNGGLEAGPYAVFTGPGKVEGTPQVAAVLPEWLGSLGAQEGAGEPADWGVPINRAIELARLGCRTVRLQTRRYVLRTPVNLTSKGDHLRADMRLEGSLRSTEFRRGTLLIGETGEGNCVIDTSDSDGIHLKDVGVMRGTTTPSSIGLLQMRGTSTGWAGDQFHENVFVDMGSNPASNGGLGTIGVVNLAGEETRWQNLQSWANLPLALSWSRNLLCTQPDLNSQREFALPVSAGGITPVNDGSNTVFALTGLSRLIAYDSISPTVLINVAGSVDLGSTFLQRRPSGQAGVTPGNYRFAVENWNCYQFRHFGSIEGAGSYMLSRRDLTEADINVRMAGSGETQLPVIQLCSDGGDYRLANNRITVFTYDVERPFLGMLRRYGGPEIPFALRNNSVRSNLSQAVGGQGLDAMKARMKDNDFLFE